ncbi:AEC family transporter [Methylopila sp. M107]|uniref:AEC family transporter n=1 Tax=Methylopila sp. M107 TaxID=1101190 RepID=UPI000379EA6C|nr:AEC family transporter [Methylopila sp. M107]
MQAILNAALPIFALILTGFLCGRFGMFAPEATSSINRFAAYLALPALLFVAMTRITPDQLGQLGFMVAYLVPIVVIYAAGFVLARLRGLGLAGASLGGLTASYSNVGFMGVPLCLLVFGEDGLQPAVVATLFTACVQFLFAIALIEIEARRGRSAWRTAGKVAGSLVANPLCLAPLLGLAIGVSGLSLPVPVERFASLLGGAATPCALICIGLFFADQAGTRQDAGAIGATLALKLLAQPAIAAVLALYVFDMPPLWAHAAILLSALPIGAGAFTVAQLYMLQTGVTSGAIMMSHVASVATLSLLLVWLS